MIEHFANAALTTLASPGVDASTTSIPVTSSGTPFPVVGQFRLLVEDEVMLVTVVPDGTHFTVTRGAEGTTPAAHVAGTSVRHVITAGALNQFGADQVTLGAEAGFPSDVRTGMLRLPTDHVTPSVRAASAWQNFGLMAPFHPPPAAGTWTALNTPAALVSSNGSLKLPGSVLSTAVHLRGYYRAAPATPYAIDIGFTINVPAVNTWQAGPIWRSTDARLTAVLITMFQQDNISPGYHLRPNTYFNPDSWDWQYQWVNNKWYIGDSGGLAGVHWIRLEDDGTNRKVSVSCNGLDWDLGLSIGRTTFHTPTQVGFVVNTLNSYWLGSMRLLSWYEH